VVKWRKILRFGLKKLPKPMLEDGFRSLAITGEPVEAHLSVQRLVIVRQRLPVDEGQVDQPHVRGAHVLQESLPKDKKVTSVLHVRTSSQYGLEDVDFEELHTKCLVLSAAFLHQKRLARPEQLEGHPE